MGELWTGYYEFNGLKYKMECDSLSLDFGKVEGFGHDAIGQFDIKGEIRGFDLDFTK